MIPHVAAQLRRILANSHAPYSGVHVAAAVEAPDGRLHYGVNVENAAYRLGTCAETLAIASMVRDGGHEVKALLVLGDGDPLVTPCGGCRQRLREFAAPGTPVLVANRDEVRKRFTLEELLPASFGPENLSS